MDKKSQDLFEIVARGDDLTLQRLLLEGKTERNIATLAVSYFDHFMRKSIEIHLVIFYSMETLVFMKHRGKDSVEV